METDIAVIEEYDPEGYGWVIVAYIGPDRTDGEVEFDSFKIRIRYLDKKEH